MVWVCVYVCLCVCVKFEKCIYVILFNFFWENHTSNLSLPSFLPSFVPSFVPSFPLSPLFFGFLVLVWLCMRVFMTRVTDVRTYVRACRMMNVLWGYCGMCCVLCCMCVEKKNFFGGVCLKVWMGGWVDG
ncbi:hypothetical protein DM02DRAFT_200559 [Periconia macrospinosa]|uniref:Uncharacterized protein n=1 Tax=Periconia macrospinosa TaxID=97972 RepID=A0A2V1DAG6_9PLEO|nr:hypothetical protein DM02DRAFT_200559 [Periconia macrospinosa]